MLFYKITSPDGKVSHLFGTIHYSPIKAAVILPEEVKIAFDNAQSCIFESSISELKSEDAREALEDSIKKWSSENNSNDPPLVAFYKKAGRKRDQRKYFLDEELMQAATEQGKKLIYLETAEEQNRVLYGLDFNYDEQLTIIRHYTKKRIANVLKNSFKQSIYHNYLHSTGYSNLHRSSGEPCVQRYFFAMVNARDETMANRMKKHIEVGNVFIAVGASHLEGIVDHLKRDGYLIEGITLSPRVHSIHGSLEEGYQVQAFIKIYLALYEGQSSLFKWVGLPSNEGAALDFNFIEEYVSNHPDTRSAAAWELAKEYYLDITDVNLFEAIHQYSLKHSSSFLFFRCTQNFSDGEYTEEKIKKASNDSRTGKIRQALS